MIASLRRALRLPAADLRALGTAAAAQLVIAVALRSVGFRAVRWMVDRQRGRRIRGFTGSGLRGFGGSRVRGDIARTLWAIEAAGRHLGPASSCFSRALAAHWMAGRAGVQLPVSIGVARDATGGLEAHAWIVAPAPFGAGIGAADRYTPLVVLGGDPSDAPETPHAR